MKSLSDFIRRIFCAIFRGGHWCIIFRSLPCKLFKVVREFIVKTLNSKKTFFECEKIFPSVYTLDDFSGRRQKVFALVEWRLAVLDCDTVANSPLSIINLINFFSHTHSSLVHPHSRRRQLFADFVYQSKRVHESQFQYFFKKFGYWVNKPCDLRIKQRWLLISLQQCFSLFYLIVNCRPTMRHRNFFLNSFRLLLAARPLSRFACEKKDSFQWTSQLEGEFHCLNRFIEIFFSFLRVQTDIAFDVYTGFAWPQTVRNKEDKSLFSHLPGLKAPKSR